MDQPIGRLYLRMQAYMYAGCIQKISSKIDQDKISFIISNDTFYYTVMLFGLKNVGVTYQRPMDMVFRQQIGRNIEVYVDNILVK